MPLRLNTTFGLFIRHPCSATDAYNEYGNRSQQCKSFKKHQWSAHLLGLYCRSAVLDGHYINLSLWPLDENSPPKITPRPRCRHRSLCRTGNCQLCYSVLQYAQSTHSGALEMASSLIIRSPAPIVAPALDLVGRILIIRILRRRDHFPPRKVVLVPS